MSDANGAQANVTVKIEIDGLLYYAPRFANAGDVLNGQQRSAHAQLAALGSFWGNGKFGAAFGKQYQPAQDMILHLVGLAAAGVQGISHGIRAMADSYQVTEAGLSGQIAQLQAHERAIAGKDGGR
jgi:hypothetical protein